MVFTKKYFWIVLAVAATAGIFAATKMPRIPVKAASVEFALLDGSRLAMSSLNGRPVLINFWATSCQPCRKEIPELIKLYQELRPRGLEIVGVAMPYDPPAGVLEFKRRYSIPYPIALDLQGRITKAFDGVSLIPATFVVAPDGSIVFHQLGLLDIEKVRELILRLLKEGPTTA